MQAWSDFELKLLTNEKKHNKEPYIYSEQNGIRLMKKTTISDFELKLSGGLGEEEDGQQDL